MDVLAGTTSRLPIHPSLSRGRPHIDSASRVPVLYATTAGNEQATTKSPPDATTALPRVHRGGAYGAGDVLEGADGMSPPIGSKSASWLSGISSRVQAIMRTRCPHGFGAYRASEACAPRRKWVARQKRGTSSILSCVAVGASALYRLGGAGAPWPRRLRTSRGSASARMSSRVTKPAAWVASVAGRGPATCEPYGPVSPTCLSPTCDARHASTMGATASARHRARRRTPQGARVIGPSCDTLAWTFPTHEGRRGRARCDSSGCDRVSPTAHAAPRPRS